MKNQIRILTQLGTFINLGNRKLQKIEERLRAGGRRQKEQSDGDSNPIRLKTPCRWWGFLSSWRSPEGFTKDIIYIFCRLLSDLKVGNRERGTLNRKIYASMLGGETCFIGTAVLISPSTNQSTSLVALNSQVTLVYKSNTLARHFIFWLSGIREGQA